MAIGNLYTDDVCRQTPTKLLIDHIAWHNIE